jgi:AcrR family transcriptional regulator
VKTPWGDTEQLRARRLRPGRQPQGQQGTIANQRRRLLAAMVEATSERGYAATTVADLTRLSGVSTGAFYQCFASKETCFLTGVDALYGEGMRRVKVGYRREGAWEERIRAAFAELVDLLVSEPAACRMCLVDVFEAGAVGAERAERGAAGFEVLVRRSIDRDSGQGELPNAIVAGVVRGIQLLIHDKLRRETTGEMPDLMEELVEWGLSYRTPPPALRRLRARPEAGGRLLEDEPVERLLRALAELVAEKGYPAVSVNELASRAGTSLRTLYANFAGKEEAFLACIELARARIRAEIAAAQEDALDWPQGIATGNVVLCDWLAAEPVLAEAVMLGVLAAGPRALEDRDDAIKSYTAQLRGHGEGVRVLPPIAPEAIAFGRYALVALQIARYGPRSLPALAPTLTYFVLAPFLGAKGAAAVANERHARSSVGGQVATRPATTSRASPVDVR